MSKKLQLIVLFFFFFNGLILSQDYEIFVSDAGNFSNPPWQILKFDQNGLNPEVFINEELAWPQDIVFIENQEVVLISNLNSGRITKYDSNTGEYIEDFATVPGGPTRMKIGADNLLYVLQWGGNGRVLRFNLDGTSAADFTTTGVPRSIGLDWDLEGNLYVSSYNNSAIVRFDTSGNFVDIFANSNLNGPTNIWFDRTGNLLALNWNNPSNIAKFNSEGNFIETVSTGLSQCEGIDFLPNGNWLIGNGGTSEVKEYTTNGTFVSNRIESGLGNLIRPNAIVYREIPQLSISEIELSKTKIVQNSIGNQFELQPNINIRFSNLSIFDDLGRRVLSNKLTTSSAKILDVGNWANGIYYLVVYGKNEKQIQKIIKTGN